MRPTMTEQGDTMLTYQDTILDTLAQEALRLPLNIYSGDMRDVIVSQNARFANGGRLIAQHPADLTTLATLDYDFQTHRVLASLNGGVQPGQPSNGPRSDTIFHWIPGDPSDDHEIARLREAWMTAIREKIIAGLAPKHAEYYRKALKEATP